MSTVETDQLPEGWRRVRVGDALKLRNGRAFKASEWTTSGRPIIRIQNLKSADATFNHFDGRLPDTFAAKPGDLLFAWSGTPGTSFGAHVWDGPEAWINQHIFRVDFSADEFDRDFLKLALDLNLSMYIEQAQGGVGLAHITKTKLNESVLLVPPLTEQRRIATTVAAITAKRQSSVDRLAAARRLLERFRRSLLAAACSGRLTAEWREDNSTRVDSAEDLIEACRAERRERLGQKAVSPELVNNLELPPLPSSWRWKALGELTLRIGDVDHKMPKAQPLGVPYVSTKDFTSSGINFDLVKLIAPRDFERLSKKIVPERDDILISRYGTVGEVRRVTTSRPFQASYSVAIVKTCNSVDLAKWLSFVLMSPVPQEFMRQHIRASAQPDLGLQHIRLIPVPIAPRAEQAEIVRRAERLLSIADVLDDRIEAAMKRVERSSQAVLAKAFRGEILPASVEASAVPEQA